MLYCDVAFLCNGYVRKWTCIVALEKGWCLERKNCSPLFFFFSSFYLMFMETKSDASHLDSLVHSIKTYLNSSHTKTLVVCPL